MRLKKQGKKIRRGRREGKEKHRAIRVGCPCRDRSPAGSQSNKVVRGCFAGCKFSPCGLSVSILLLLLFPLSLCNCEPSLCTSFRDTRKWPCSRSPIQNPLVPSYFSIVSHPFVRLFILTLSNPDRRRIAITWDTHNHYAFICNSQIFLRYVRKMYKISYTV